MGFSFSEIFGLNTRKPSVSYAYLYRVTYLMDMEKTVNDMADRITDYLQRGYQPLGGIQTTALSDGKILLTQSLFKTA